jgi:hypothetical protein
MSEAELKAYCRDNKFEGLADLLIPQEVCDLDTLGDLDVDSLTELAAGLSLGQKTHLKKSWPSHTHIGQWRQAKAPAKAKAKAPAKKAAPDPSVLLAKNGYKVGQKLRCTQYVKSENKGQNFCIPNSMVTIQQGEFREEEFCVLVANVNGGTKPFSITPGGTKLFLRDFFAV